MVTYENIEGAKLQSIFEQLVQDQTLVKVFLPQNAFECLTVVTRTEKKVGSTLFCIAPPNGLLAAVKDVNARSINFEYNSADRVTHRFEARIRNASSDSVKLMLPDFIQRHQQRSNFRVKVFNESFAKILLGDTELRLPIDNVSLGGIFCLCPNKFKSKFIENQILTNLELFFTLEKSCFSIQIKQTRVNRLESSSMRKHFGIAFEFMRIKREHNKILIQQIYELQRYFLKNRLKYL